MADAQPRTTRVQTHGVSWKDGNGEAWKACRSVRKRHRTEKKPPATRSRNLAFRSNVPTSLIKEPSDAPLHHLPIPLSTPSVRQLERSGKREATFQFQYVPSQWSVIAPSAASTCRVSRGKFYVKTQGFFSFHIHTTTTFFKCIILVTRCIVPCTVSTLFHPPDASSCSKFPEIFLAPWIFSVNWE